MSPPEMRNGGSARQPNPPDSRKISPTDQQDVQHRKGSAIRRVRGRLLMPSGRRGLPAIVVICPNGCGGVHLHRGHGGLRQAGCGRGSYVIIPAVEQRGAAA